jgi:hypothetical protein
VALACRQLEAWGHDTRRVGAEAHA